MTRYALYFAPEDGTALHRIGWGWLGRRPDSPEPVAPLCAEAAAWIAEPRRYGFHATLKPPFRLAENRTREQLVAALAEFAAARTAFVSSPLSLQPLDGFLALRPRAPASRLDQLAADCVREFDAFRAPAPPEELARRLAAGLTPRQADYLQSWGYPYVFEEFRFHMTLTSRLDDGPREAARQQLLPLLRPVLDEPLLVASLCLFEQAEGMPFVLGDRFAFRRP